jgi:predicted phage terminase large subunit-like protein
MHTLEEKRTEDGAAAFDVVYQGDAEAIAGVGKFRREWFDGKILDAIPDEVAFPVFPERDLKFGPPPVLPPPPATKRRIRGRVRAWDFASGEVTRGDPDWSVGLLAFADYHNNIYIMHVDRFRGTDATTEARFKQRAQQDGRSVKVIWEKEGGSAGAMVARFLRGALADYNTAPTSPGGKSKLIRAIPFATACEQGRVYLIAGGWDIPAFIDELVDFPFGNHDDQVDVGAYAYNELMKFDAEITDTHADDTGQAW